MTEAEKQALLDRLDKIASVGATVLSNATTDQGAQGALVIGG